MTDRSLRNVLVVDDEIYTCKDTRARFLAHNKAPDGTFHFEVDIATTIADAVEKVRARTGSNQFHVIVLDLFFDVAGVNREGLRIADALGLCRRLGQTIPVEIIFSGYADLQNCVQAMRHGAWDVIDKAEGPDGDPFDRVVASAVAGLKAVNLQEHLSSLAVPWLQKQITGLQAKYGGQVIAIWHEPEVGVVAHGRDVFELEARLGPWRAEHPAWMYPFVTQIPEVGDSTSRGGGAR